MWIISLADDSHEMSRLFSEKKKKVKLFSIAVVIGALRDKLSAMVTSLQKPVLWHPMDGCYRKTVLNICPCNQDTHIFNPL